jgi:hypothetical protein
LIPTAKRTDILKKETGFYIRGFHTDGTGYSIGLIAPDATTKYEWIAAISTAIAKIKCSAYAPTHASYHEKDSSKQSCIKDTTTLEFTKGSLVSSPNLRVLATRLNPICIEASPVLPWLSKESDTNAVTGAPPATTHFRFLFPSAHVQSMMHRSLVTGVEDPDFLLLMFGGFAYLDADENILGTSYSFRFLFKICLF